MGNKRVSIVLKYKINALARGFYMMMGYQVEEGYDFSKAKHPTEKMVWEQAKLAQEFWCAPVHVQRPKGDES